MIVRKHFHPFYLTSIGIAIFLIAVQPQAVAQVPANSSAGGEQSSTTLPLKALSFLPDLPPLEPIFPEVTDQKIRLIIRLKKRRVYVYRGKNLQITYPIAVGRPGWETPVGQFQIIAMLRNPGWTNPLTGEVIPAGLDSPLGDRWIAFWTDGKNYVGFHGTPDRVSVGKAASHGCIRMFNENVRALFEMVSIGTSVTVEP